jgi:hypothetical protein
MQKIFNKKTQVLVIAILFKLRNLEQMIEKRRVTPTPSGKDTALLHITHSTVGAEQQQSPLLMP